MERKDDRLNETRINNNGERMTIVRYGGKNDIDVQFQDGTIVEHRKYCAFKIGNVKNPMTPIVYGIGYMGIGNYSSRDENGKKTKTYDTWHNMYQRCYNHKYHEKCPSYKNCTVCEEWYNYQVFGKWCDENYYEVENERMTLDKDILCKGNKVYSPDTCIFVPVSINSLFVKRDTERGEFPIGVSKYRNKFVAQLSKGDGKPMYLGVFNTPEEAFQAYKQTKEQYIKEVAEKYKSQKPQKLYDAMIAYEVEIDD